MWTRVKNRFKQALERTSQGVQKGWSSLFQGRSLQDVDWELLEETLLSADVGLSMTEKFLTAVRQYKGDIAHIREYLIEYTAELMHPFQGKLEPAPVVLLVGVNGSGKTTTLGKLAHLWGQQGQHVHVIAGDTFRAGAVEQLGSWVKDLPMTTGGADPASVVYQGLMRAKERQDTVVLIDTAGRLPNQAGLMDQVRKIHGIIERLRPHERCEIILTLDATVGQHALKQIQGFNEAAPITGIIMNKMDGSAKGGILLNIAQQYRMPIYGVGVGESVQDWQPFSAQDYASGLWGGRCVSSDSISPENAL
jgi:fused signal recognition particle receptor